MQFHKCLMSLACMCAIVTACDGVDESEGQEVQVSDENASVDSEVIDAVHDQVSDENAALDEADENAALDEAEFDLKSIQTPALGGCSDPAYNVSVNGGKASWTLVCAGNRIYVKGSVKDTLVGFGCAYVTAYFSDGTKQSAQNCGLFTSATQFQWDGPGNSVKVYLSVL